VKGAGDPVQLAIVHGAGEVYFVVAARDRQALLAELCARLLEDLERQLFAPEADRFTALVEGKSLDEAVRFYFSEVGRKWDPVRLRLETVEAA